MLISICNFISPTFPILHIYLVNLNKLTVYLLCEGVCCDESSLSRRSCTNEGRRRRSSWSLQMTLFNGMPNTHPELPESENEYKVMNILI